MLENVLRARKDIKKAVRKNRDLATKASGGYETSEAGWALYDSPLSSFAHTFASCLPADWESNDVAEKRFKEYIEKTLSEGKVNDLTAIEFGGPGSILFTGCTVGTDDDKKYPTFTKDFFKKTLGVCLKDIRFEYQEKKDTERNHHVLEGDILYPERKPLFYNITSRLGTEKTDLILSKMEGPVNIIDKNPAVLDRIIRNWYSLLNENGLMFIQFFVGMPPLMPPENARDRKYALVSYQKYTDLKTSIDKWAVAIKERHPQIDIQVRSGAIRLHKQLGSPNELPPATQLFK